MEKHMLYAILNARQKENVKVFLYHENCIFVFNLNLENFLFYKFFFCYFFDKCSQNNLHFLDIQLYNRYICLALVFLLLTKVSQLKIKFSSR